MKRIALALAVLVLLALPLNVFADGYQVQTSAIAFPTSSYEAVATYNYAPSWSKVTAGSFFYTDTTTLGSKQASGTIDSTGTLTAATDTATYQAYLYGYDLQSGAFAAADLATGELKASAYGNYYINTILAQEGIGYAAFYDTLHPAGAGTAHVQFTLDGTVSVLNGSWGNSDLLDWNMWFGNASLILQARDNYSTGFVLTGSPVAQGWTNYSFTAQDPDHVIFDGWYAVSGLDKSIAVSGGLKAVGGDGMAIDYSHTAKYTLDGISYTSDSGVFLTGSATPGTVPEPGTLSLIGASLAGLGWIRWRRK